MDKQFDELYENLEKIVFNSFEFRRITDERLKYVDCYYIDTNMEKYLFICKVFGKKADMLDQIDDCQDEDISYLQGEVFANRDIRWDMYFLLLYTGDEKLSFEEYNKIEKNKFYCKKLIIRSQSFESMKKDLNRKLPITGLYYSFDTTGNCLNPDNSFFEIFRKEAGLDKELFSDKYLQSISESSKNDFIEKLYSRKD